MPFCCRKGGGTFVGLIVGFCITLGNELSEETRVLTEPETFLRRGAWVESSRVTEPGELVCHVWLAVSGFMVMGLVSRLSVASHVAWFIA